MAEATVEAALAGIRGRIDVQVGSSAGLPQSFRWVMEIGEEAALVEDAVRKLRALEDDRAGVPLDIRWPDEQGAALDEDDVLVDVMAVDAGEGQSGVTVLLRPRPGNASGMTRVD